MKNKEQKEKINKGKEFLLCDQKPMKSNISTIDWCDALLPENDRQ